MSNIEWYIIIGGFILYITLASFVSRIRGLTNEEVELLERLRQRENEERYRQAKERRDPMS